MILTAHQPVYLPWIGLFHKIALADEFVFFDQVQYVPKDYISRNEIKSNNGKTLLSVPVKSKGYLDKSIAEIEIDNSNRWNEKHWKSISINYKKAAYFHLYADFFEYLYKREWQLLADLNYHSLIWFLNTLGIKTKISKAGEFNFEGTKSDLVLDMCLKMKASVYIFGSQGKNYANEGKFHENGINLVFQNYIHPKYTQQHGEFVPNLSIIDLLFNEGPNSLEIIMSGNTIK